MPTKTDVIVIGGGPGGYVAAIRSAQLGFSVTLVEESHLGGVCLNWGCIPTKALLHGAMLVKNIQQGHRFGIHSHLERIDIQEMVAQSRQVAKSLSAGISSLLRSNNVKVIMGHASFQDTGMILVESANEKSLLKASSIILATGGRSNILPSLRRKNHVWDYKKAMLPDSLPKKLAVVGGGAIGVEFASFYHMLGSQVTIIEQKERLIPSCDEEISQALYQSFEKQGIKILTKTSVIGFHPTDHTILRVQGQTHEEHISCERVICATGMKPNLDNINLHIVDPHMDGQHVWTNHLGATSVKNLYAIGDIAGAPWLAHKSSHEGMRAAESIAGIRTTTEQNKNLPIAFCTYTSPQTACVGLTEKEAIEAGYSVKKGLFPFRANGRSLAMGGGEGFIKLLFDEKTGALLGAHLIGDEVSELIHSLVLAMQLEATEEDLFATIFPHPTLSEAIHEASLDAFDRSIHMFRRK